jgi:cell division protein FtsL
MALSDEVYEAGEAFQALPLPIDLLPVDAPDAERAAHLRVAPDSVELLRRRRRARLIVLLGAAVSAASMFLLVAFHVWAVQASFQYDKLQTQLTAEQRKYGMLRDEVATRSSPEAIAHGAEGLGMVRPAQVFVLRPPTAKPIDAQDDLPVPPAPPYHDIGPDQ